MKKLINRPVDVVEEMVEGLAATYPGLSRLAGQTVLLRTDWPSTPDQRSVALISGGGSGHEPAHAGYIGRGMLTAAVAGDVFTSPSPDAVFEALRAVAGPRGVLLIVKNYTGDRLNFGLAAERARAEGIGVELVIVADDVALAGSVVNAGRRGIAGTVLVHKVAGAAAESGLSLAEVAGMARNTADQVRTMGVALSPCTVPAAGRPGFTLDDDEIELGLGIHGEPGVRRTKIEPADPLVDQLLDPIADDLVLHRGERVVLLVNNLGGTPTLELAIVARRAIANLEARGLVVERVYCGTFLSALEMAGVSLSVLRVDDRRLAFLDAPTDAPAWPNAADRARHGARTLAEPAATSPPARPAREPRTDPGRRFRTALLAVVDALVAAEPRLTALDQAVGDGDLGISLTRGAKALRDALPALPLDDLPAALHEVGLLLQHRLGGTSGPLYAVFLLRASNVLRDASPSDPSSWAAAFRDGCAAISELGGAHVGDRTMLDALDPAANAFTTSLQAGHSPAEALAEAAIASETAARETASMIPTKGRASYLGQRALGHADPGAVAVAIVLKALAGSTSERATH